jgi:hypothetical protein
VVKMIMKKIIEVFMCLHLHVGVAISTVKTVKYTRPSFIAGIIYHSPLTVCLCMCACEQIVPVSLWWNEGSMVLIFNVSHRTGIYVNNDNIYKYSEWH